MNYITSGRSVEHPGAWSIYAGSQRELVADFYGPYARVRAHLCALELEKEFQAIRRRGVTVPGLKLVKT